MGKESNRIPISGESNRLIHNPFGSLDGGTLPDGPRPAAKPADKSPEARKRTRGRVDIRREKAGRGGKIVTVISGFTGVAGDERAAMARQLQKTCGVGGTIKAGKIELQGDQVGAVFAWLEAAGFRPVRTGG